MLLLMEIRMPPVDDKDIAIARLEGRVQSLEVIFKDHKEQFQELERKFDAVGVRLNTILGGLIVACLLLAANLAMKAIGG